MGKIHGSAMHVRRPEDVRFGMMRRFLLASLVLLTVGIAPASANRLLVPMDDTQTDHLKAYGVAYFALAAGAEVDWLLNYRGGSFAFPDQSVLEEELLTRGIRYQKIALGTYNSILEEIKSESSNMDAVKLEVPPKIAVYSPKSAQPWDDAVTMVLTYAEIPYDVIYDAEVMQDTLASGYYDWLHLHHEDFTGQYGKFYLSYHNQPWYREQVQENEETAQRFGFQKVSQLKLAVAKRIREFVSSGGFLFAMCSATDSYDIALAAEGTDICAHFYDGDGQAPNYQSQLDFNQSIAFQQFTIEPDPLRYEYSNIDVTQTRRVPRNLDYFTLFEFSAKWDPVPTMLCQNHTRTIKGFMGQTTAFRADLLKPEVLVMGQLKSANEARYIHGNIGEGMWTFYGGHDPEDYQHLVYEEPTDLALHKNSPGYRLILNNILFPAARKKPQKT